MIKGGLTCPEKPVSRCRKAWKNGKAESFLPEKINVRAIMTKSDMTDKCIVKIVNHSSNPLPAFQSAGASGMDICADLKEPLILEPHRVYAVSTGIFMEIPEGYEAQVRARSGLALKHGITLVNGIGTIDSDYRGEIKVILMNLLDEPFTIHPGDRIAQMVIARYCHPEFVQVDHVDDLEETQRGEGGFGHSGL